MNAAGDNEAITVLPARRGCSVNYRGRTLLSRVDPLSAAERVLGAFLPAAERTLYLCPSPLFGYGLAAFAEALPVNSALLCVEADTALAAWTRENIDAALAAVSKTAFVHAESSAVLCRFVREHWGQRRFRRVTEINLTGGRALNAARYDEFTASLRDFIALEWGNAMTLTKLGRRYIHNFLRNLPLLAAAPPLSVLDFGKRPVLVAGAGPSLDLVLDALAPPYPVIIAVDSALSALLERGIRPDLTVALEAQHWNLADFCGWGGEPLPLAMDMSALSAQADFAGGSPYLFWTPWTELRLFDRLRCAGVMPPEMPPLGSVGLCAVKIALTVSAGPVVAAGIDFAFTLEGYHARGSPTHRATLRGLSRLSSPYPIHAVFRAGSRAAVSKTGAAVRTDPALRRYRGLFAAEFAAERSRLFEIECAGLPLGVTVTRLDEALRLLGGGSLPPAPVPHSGWSVHANADAPTGVCPPASPSPKGLRPLKSPPARRASHAALAACLDHERNLLGEIRAMLTGERAADAARLNALIDDADYLWAHFPDCAAAGGRRPPLSDSGFLKRLRTELDPILRLLSP